MKKYCYISQGLVSTITPEFEEIFPSVPIEQRYSKEFIDKCIVVDESVEVSIGMIYENGVFVDPPEPNPVVIAPDNQEIPQGEFEALQNEVATLWYEVMLLGGA